MTSPYRSTNIPGAEGRVVVVHGVPAPGLDALLRAGGLVPVHQADAVSVWAVPEAVPAGQDPVVAPPGSGRLLLTITEAAERLAVGRSTVYELVNRGDIETVHVGRSARIPVAAVQRFAAGLSGRAA
jgi:excisionase family DNA binding protein